MYYEKHRTNKRTGKRRAFAALMAVAVLICAVEIRMRPVVSNAVKNESRQLFTDCVNEAVFSAVTDADTHGGLVNVTYGADGKAAALSTDQEKLNLLSTAISKKISKELDSGKMMSSEVCAGALTGTALLASCGPKVPVRMKLMGGAVTKVRERFESAGINQTHHIIECIVSADVMALLPGYSRNLSLSASVLLSDTVIIGDVPQSYTSVNGDQSDTIGRIFDYGDPYGEDVS